MSTSPCVPDRARIERLESLVTRLLARPSGGGPGTVTPLSRMIFVDGGTTVATPTGSIAAPYPTIQQAINAIPVAGSAAEAQDDWMIVVTPCAGGYASEPGGQVVLPAYQSVVLYGWAGEAALNGTELVVFADLVWVNKHSAAKPGQPASPGVTAGIYDLLFTGDFTVTDDGTVPENVQCINPNAFGFDGSFDAPGATAFFGLDLQGTFFGGGITLPMGGLSTEGVCQIAGPITVPALTVVTDGLQALSDVTCSGDVTCMATAEFQGMVSASAVAAVYSSFGGGITAPQIAASWCNLSGTVTTGNAEIFATTWGNNATLDITAAGPNVLTDGDSMQSFFSLGGTLSGPGTVMVQGGYSACAITGPALPASGLVNVSLEEGNRFYARPGTLTAPLTVVVQTAGASGQPTLAVVIAPQGFDVTVQNDNASASVTIPSGSFGSVLWRYDSVSGHMQLEGGGTLT